jgi:hypothetical protein
MKRSVFFVSLMMTVMAALVFNGCSKPHEAEKAAARTAMEASRSAGADRYAPEDFAEARKLWVASEAQVKEKKYQEAKQGYIEARIAFEKAGDAVEAGKRAMIPEAAAAVAALEEGWRNLEVIAKRVEPKMGKTKLWEADLKNFREGLKAAKEMVNADPAGAKAKADQLTRFIDTYGEYFKRLTVNPGKPPATRKKATTAEED